MIIPEICENCSINKDCTEYNRTSLGTEQSYCELCCKAKKCEELNNGVTNIFISILKPYIWYRKSTKEWVVSVEVRTNNCSLSIQYSNKKKNKALKNFYKNISSDILEEEIKYRIQHKELVVKQS